MEYNNIKNLIRNNNKHTATQQCATKVPFRVLWHFTHKANVTSVNAEANAHSADWLMSVFVSELGSQGPAPYTQSTRSMRAAVPKDCESDFSFETYVQKWF